VRHDHPSFPIWFGVGAYLCRPESAAAKVDEARRSGADGWILFSYTAVTHEGADDRYLRSLSHKLGLAWHRAARGLREPERSRRGGATVDSQGREPAGVESSVLQPRRGDGQ